MSYRVLLVDDYEPWRRYVDSRLMASPQWQIAGEAADGLDAIQKAEALRPDLILLDVGLPSLNGIVAARRILAHNPGSRILFLSEHSSWEIVAGALSAGGRGYVLKSDAGSELLPAMESIVEGRQFVSSSLKRQDSATKDPQPIAGLHHPDRSYHGVGFYSDDESLLAHYAPFAEAALNAGKVLIVLGIDSRQPSLEKKLAARGFDVDRLAREGRYRWWDVAEAIDTLLVKDLPDETRFWSVVPPRIKEAAAASTAKPLGLRCGENSRPPCGVKVKRRPRFGSSNCGMSSSEPMTSIPSARTPRTVLSGMKAVPTSRESARHIPPY